MSHQKPRVAVHKFSSCDGCQLSILNLGEALLDVVGMLDIQHFAEAGILNELAPVDIALVEGSVSTPADVERIQAIRSVSHYLVTIGACATAGGLQALRNAVTGDSWSGQIYAKPEFIASLDKVSAIKEHVKVDWEIWGCPVDSRQVLSAIAALSAGMRPREDQSKLCQECKQHQFSCVVVSKGEPCLGPVTRQGCGALCPGVGRGCYGCYGPAENSQPEIFLAALAQAGSSATAFKANLNGIYNNIEPYRSLAREQTDHE